jgi:molybdenum cofactor guanylyltransferase
MPFARAALSSAYAARVSRFAGIVLAGGRSSRMGRPKASLEWRGVTLVEHLAAVVASSIEGPVVVAAAQGQALPDLRGIALVRDARAGRGPLEGIAAGMRAVATAVDAVFVTATDTPFLTRRFVQFVCSALTLETDGAVPLVGDRMHPLAAVYRTSNLALVEKHLAEDRLRAVDLVDAMRVRWISEEELRTVDPELASLRNLNTPQEYAEAVAQSSLPGRCKPRPCVW